MDKKSTACIRYAVLGPKIHRSVLKSVSRPEVAILKINRYIMLLLVFIVGFCINFIEKLSKNALKKYAQELFRHPVYCSKVPLGVILGNTASNAFSGPGILNLIKNPSIRCHSGGGRTCSRGSTVVITKKSFFEIARRVPISPL